MKSYCSSSRTAISGHRPRAQPAAPATGRRRVVDVVVRGRRPGRAVRGAGQRAVVTTGRRRTTTARVTHPGQRARLVGDDQQGDAGSTSRASDRARACWLAGSTPAVGSSMISTSGSAGQRAGDQHPALLAAGQLGDVGARPGRPGRPRRSPRRPPRRSAAAQPAEPAAAGPAGPTTTTSRDGGRHAAADGVPLRHVADPAARAARPAGGPEQLAPRRRARWPARAARAPGSTCPSRWRRARRRPRRARRQVDVADDGALAVARRSPRAAARPHRSPARLPRPAGWPGSSASPRGSRARPSVGQPLDGVEHRGPGAGLAGEGVGDGRADQRLGVDRARRRGRATKSATVGQPPRGRARPPG